jgi:hypothetical protein
MLTITSAERPYVITTKTLAATTHRGTRVKAFLHKRSVTLPWDYAQNVPNNHDAAARALLESLKWGGAWVAASSSDDSGYVYVCENR